MEEDEVVVDEELDLAVLRGIETVDVAALMFVKTRVIVLIGLKEMGLDSGGLYGGGWILVLE